MDGPTAGPLSTQQSLHPPKTGTQSPALLTSASVMPPDAQESQSQTGGEIAASTMWLRKTSGPTPSPNARRMRRRRAAVVEPSPMTMFPHHPAEPKREGEEVQAIDGIHGNICGGRSVSRSIGRGAANSQRAPATESCYCDSRECATMVVCRMCNTV